ncbi:Benzoate 4-monooxygenase [Lecanosticta acicola]|uniref:Benzoate 4-monooxygenase n=1 Tax=Lecanosticta acicola TaxID=111012 RepID=A0AAI8YXH4_9PEZI|nr:Benzoate 4-monooxygenase [Lecanosticta acicola]
MASSPIIIQILDKPEHDGIVAQSKDMPTVIYVSNSVLPACKAFGPKFHALVEQWSPRGIRFCQLEFTDKTSMMFKFAPNQLPVTVFMVHDNWCKTVMGADAAAMEIALGELLEQDKKAVQS